MELEDDWDGDTKTAPAPRVKRGQKPGVAMSGHRRRVKRGTEKKPDAAYAQPVQVDLENGDRITVAREIFNPYVIGGEVLMGHIILKNQNVLVRFMDSVAQWRPCDSSGKYRKILMPNDTAPWRDKTINCD